jgi:hypothetical protein
MNWGKAITIVFVLFASGIIYLVYRSTQTHFELVEDNYYEEELGFQDQINQRNLAVEKGQVLQSWKTATKVTIKIDGCLEPVAAGEVWFYDAQERNNDRKFTLQRSDSAIWEIPLSALGSSGVKRNSYEIKALWIVGKDTMRGVANW